MTPTARTRIRDRVHRLRRFLNHPATLFGSAIAVFATALHEVIETLEAADLGAEHGLLVYSFLQAARALPELLEKIERAEESLLEPSAIEPGTDA